MNETSNIVYKKSIKKSSKQRLKKECKYDSKVYSTKIIDLIASSTESNPFFIYLALFTKTYPREILKDRFKDTLQDAKKRDHLRKMTAMDESVKDIVKALKQTGHYDNTVIFFMSDNENPMRIKIILFRVMWNHFPESGYFFKLICNCYS